MKGRSTLKRYAWLSVAAAVVTITLKVLAYILTGSVGLLSDALESGVNLAAALFALMMLSIAASPPDEEHAYGHSKAEYFSSGVEGALILIASVTIAISAVRRLLEPQPLEQIGLGLVFSIVAALSNLAVSRVLLLAGRQHDSITLNANAQHLMADVWTSGGVVVGVAAVAVTGWQFLDPLIALVVAAQILNSGVRLVKNAALGLMDTMLPMIELDKVVNILEQYCSRTEVSYHALRTRQSGAQRFVSVHIQVPGTWTVQKGHSLLEEIERDIRDTLPLVSVFTHLEPSEDPTSWQDIPLNRDNA